MKKKLGAVVLLLLGGSVLLHGCGDSSQIAGVRSLNITPFAGNGQAGVGGSELGSPLAVEVTDAEGVPVADVPVAWRVTSDHGGSLSTSATTTDDQGRTSVTATLPNLEDAQMTVEASPVDVSASTTFTATVTRTASGATDIQKTSGDGQVGEPRAQLSQPMVARVMNDAGGGVADIEVRFFIAEGGGSLDASTVTTDEEGRAAVAATLPEENSVTQRIGATVASLRDTAIFEASTVGRPANIAAVSGGGQSARGGTELPEPLGVEITDSEGNALSDVTVEWSITSGEGGSLSANETLTDDQGRASVTATLPNLEGASMTVEASPATTTATATFTADVTATLSGAADVLRVSGDQQSGVPGTSPENPYVVKVVDDAGGGVPDVDVEFFVVSGGGSLDASVVASDENGEASVSPNLPNVANTTQVVGATVASLRDSVQFQSTTTAFPRARVTAVAGDDQKGIAGDTLLDRIAVEVTDGQGALLEGMEVEWQISGGGGSILFGTTVSNTQGLATNRWRLGGSAGSTQQVTATVDPANAPASQTTFTATTTGPPTRILVEQGAIEEDNNATMAPEQVVGDTVTAGPGFWSRKPFRATVVDASDEEVRGAEIGWTVTSGGTVGDVPGGGGEETVTVVTGRDGAVTVWRRAPDTGSLPPACLNDDGELVPPCWIGATLSVENFPGVDPVTLDALVRP